MSSRRRYELARRLAAGGTGEVWEARALDGPHAGRDVALKRAIAALRDDPAVRRMLRDEARLLVTLEHPSIVRALDFGTIDGVEHVAYELVRGIDAARAASVAAGARGGRGRFAEDVGLFVVEQVAHALDHAHSRSGPDGRSLGIVHRDVCPANILVSWEGRVLLADFGIARGAHRTDRTITGHVKGTSGYIAPEQILGDATTQAVDVYALGATLHALLAGEPPLTSWRATSAYVGGGALPIASSIASDVAELIASCCDVDAARRPSAAEVARASRALRRGGDGADLLTHAFESIRQAVERRGPLDDLLAGVVDERTTLTLESELEPEERS
ncbi:serine/threonine-protein kinase [Sandaracinus amylolyticus]|uniref:Serine/threonine protein kinase n=1 Tax=Sandaracinus amylolyticus TaxID=927083 RepID=A0A0F6YG35_9BACT|nr:serine/threonine-protein kinase [Sandaracinus amylolyticus]AKF04282.1 serine/threonine protein kinase [Sandaracinus amylolyticus]